MVVVAGGVVVAVVVEASVGNAKDEIEAAVALAVVLPLRGAEKKRLI